MSAETITAKVTSKGQITLPLEVRRRLGIKEGDRVAFDLGPEGVAVRPARPNDSVFAQFEGALPELGDRERARAWFRELRGREE